MTKLVTKETKLMWLIKAPIRALARARDFYVNNMIRCAGQYGDGFGPIGGYNEPNGLPRSYSSASSRNADEDLRELVRASSTKVLSMRDNDRVMRCQSVGIGRIDEDKACEFDGEFVEIKVKRYPRSRSYVVSRSSMI